VQGAVRHAPTPNTLPHRHDDRCAGDDHNSIDVPVMMMAMMVMRHNHHGHMLIGESWCGGGYGDDYGREK
jgi:hypothetical protein